MTQPILSVTTISKSYGGVKALDSVTLEVWAGEVFGVIGPNGAGKSTLVGVVGGSIAATSGAIHLNGVDVTALDAPHRARLGIGRTHQIPRPFTKMSVFDNLMLAATNSGHSEKIHVHRDHVREILDRTGLAAMANTNAGNLTLLRRKRLEMARAMALRPKVLLLDEIGAGLVESETQELITLVNDLRSSVDSIVLIEHVMDVITGCCDRTAVLDFGKLVTSGPTRTVLADPEVAAVYLGTAAHTHKAEGTMDEVKTAPSARVDISSLVNLGESLVNDHALLQVSNLSVQYGGLKALRDVSIEVHEGETVALLGANGAGKTTLARAISGALPISSGEIVFSGKTLQGLRADEVTALGIAQCMEGRRIFGSLSIEENLLIGGRGVDRTTREARLSTVYEVFPILHERRKSSGTALSGGQQQMLAIGRALMSGPRLVIFDEISLGLAPIAVDRLYEVLESIKSSGVSIILVEQNVKRGLALAGRAYVLSQGKVALSGTAQEVANHPVLKSLYVG